ncbi:hypothetical protein N657DRAFT_176012 [Parathielavia appendiculata]|uniref:Uncharacterized protein n=1 Tax=Parathielavia appendiculata TaxID=2587402 RepID=A0AAN6Z773_9PEZI|nr:hypothetical protein N657DRAFT_176012 [Parathielavia appendiculata]
MIPRLQSEFLSLVPNVALLVSVRCCVTARNEMEPFLFRPGCSDYIILVRHMQEMQDRGLAYHAGTVAAQLPAAAGDAWSMTGPDIEALDLYSQFVRMPPRAWCQMSW